jgi:hypothetical protein
MQKIDDPEFEKMFHKYLVEQFGDEHILDFDIEIIAWALNYGDAIPCTNGFEVGCIDSRNSRVYTNKQQGLLTYIIQELTVGYKFTRVEDDLFCTIHGIVRGKIEGYFS